MIGKEGGKVEGDEKLILIQSHIHPIGGLRDDGGDVPGGL